jgi:hypothetical protein
MGLYAFREMLSRKRAKYVKILQHIEMALRSQQYARQRRKLEPFLARHVHGLDGIQW